MVKRVYFVRHGETDANAGSVVQGSDNLLSKKGEQQARIIAERCKSIAFDRLISSHYTRARQTADAIAEVTEKDVEVVELFHEVRRPTSFWGHLRDEEAFQNFLKEERSNYHDSTWRFEDAENFSDLSARASEAVSLLEKAEEENILVVTHGHFLRFMVSHLLLKKELTPEAWTRLGHTLLATNTGVTVCLHEEGLWQVLTWNDHAHFAE